jgi:hypothetical protein
MRKNTMTIFLDAGNRELKWNIFADHGMEQDSKCFIDEASAIKFFDEKLKNDNDVGEVHLIGNDIFKILKSLSLKVE